VLHASISNLDLKYTTLKEHINKLKQVNEEEKKSLENLKSNFEGEFSKLEYKVRTAIEEEKEHHKNNTESMVRKLESELYKYDKESKIENDKLRKTIKTLEEYLDVRI
jgi:predicted  nucleic acid-binding Zn-ribbon protein